MTTFADVGLPVFVVIFSLTLAHCLFLMCQQAWKAWKRWRQNPCRVSLRSRLRETRRLAWYKLIRRMPGSCPRQDLCRLDPDDAIAWGRLTTLIRQRGIYADDPQRDRGQRR